MKRTWTKAFALACVAALILTFAACTKDSEGETTTLPSLSETQSTQPGTEPSQTAVATENGTTAPSGASTTAATPSGLKKPASAAEAVQLYNNAVSKIRSTKGTYSRTMDSCKIAFLNLMSIDPRVPEKFNKSGANLSGAKLYQMNAGDVASYSVTENKDSFVLTFKLKDLKGGVSTTKGSGGYMYFIDFEEAKGLVKDIAQTLTNGSLKVTVTNDKGVVNLSGGSLSVTVNKKTGKLSKATLSFKEHLEAKANTSVGINGVAKVDGHGTVNYTLN